MRWLVACACGVLLTLPLQHALAKSTKQVEPATTDTPPTGLVVTEIMYDPPGANTGRQWLEITNTGSDAVDLAAKTIRLFAGGGNHVIKAVNGGTVLAAGATAVISNNPTAFILAWPDFGGLLLKSSFALAESDSIGLTYNGTLVASAAYSSALGANNDGNSLQKPQGSSVFKPGAPTPGVWAASLPALLAAPAQTSSFGGHAAVKPSGTKSGSSKQATTKSRTSTKSHGSRTSNSQAYGDGTVAPAENAEAFSAGALPSSFSIPYPSAVAAIMSSIWFACFLALVALSGFAIVALQRYYPRML